ncbi:MAG: SdrD B-like domain, partial [Solirubrobacteraceae bacterium]|nr:SdrD B-like domain [Solirubrobacteraceae bacterium]
MPRALTSRALATALVALAALFAMVATAPAASAATLGGLAFKDLNRDGVAQSSEPVLANQEIHLYAPAGPYLARAITDASGHYLFSDLADGDYRVAYDTPSWWALRLDWVPTTTPGSLRASTSVTVSGTATVDFGWRA